MDKIKDRVRRKIFKGYEGALRDIAEEMGYSVDYVRRTWNVEDYIRGVLKK